MLRKNQNTISCFFLTLMLVFKLFGVQEYAHIQQHKQEHSSYKDTCPLCVSIFKIGHNTSFEPENFTDFSTNSPVFRFQEKINFIDKFLFVNQLYLNQFFNRPPPRFS